MKKRNNLKNYLKIGILLFGVSILLFNCEKDFHHEPHVEESGTKDGTLSKKPLTEFVNDIAFKKVQDFLKINTEEVNQINLRIKETRLTAKDSSSNNFISLNTKSVIRIVRPTYTSYTFSINQLKQEDNSFRNLIINVSENKTTAFINTYIPDESYLQHKRANEKTNFSGKVYFTKYADDLSSLLKSYKLKPKLNKTSIIVCRDVLYVTFEKCASNMHWTFSPLVGPGSCDLEGSQRASTTTQVVLECSGGGSYNIDPIDGDFFLEDPLGGGPGGGATTPLDNIEDDCNTAEGYSRNSDGECVKYDCKEENKVFDEITQTCVCEDGYDPDPLNSEKCIKKPCAGDPIRNPEIAPQKGLSGIKGALFGNSAIGGCTRFGASDCNTPRNKKHEGIDIKNEPGMPVYALFDGEVHSNYRQTGKAGYVTRIRSVLPNGDIIIYQYFHLQENGRLSNGTQVKSGDIVGIQGDSGNLRLAIKKGKVDSHVHLKMNKYDGSGNSSDYAANFKNNPVNPVDYMTTKFDSAGNKTSNNCN